MRFYEKKYPDVDECVVAEVVSIEDMGAYVRLVSLSLRHPTKGSRGQPHSDCSHYPFGRSVLLTEM